ncbi:hypothetical protein MRX96_014769 [Rhipicephalus microplus]
MCRSSGDSTSATDWNENQERYGMNAVTVLIVGEAVDGIQLLRIAGRIDDIQIHVLIDTGASASLLNVQDYRK